MGLQIPLNHLVTDLYRPGQTPFEVLEGKISSIKMKSMATNILEKICYVALIALIAAVFVVSYNAIVLTGTASLVMTGMILSSPLLIMAPAKLAQWSAEYAALAETEGRVLLKMRDLKVESVKPFFEQNGLDFNRLNQDALRQVDQSEPLKALFPLIALHQSLEEGVTEIRKRGEEARQQLEAHLSQRQDIDPQDKQKLRFECRNTTSMNLELKAIPTALFAAALLQIIQNPTLTNLEIAPSALTLPGVGKCRPRSFGERLFGKQEGNDDYFVFEDSSKTALTHAQIEQAEMKSSRLRPLLFSA